MHRYPIFVSVIEEDSLFDSIKSRVLRFGIFHGVIA